MQVEKRTRLIKSKQTVVFRIWTTKTKRAEEAELNEITDDFFLPFRSACFSIANFSIPREQRKKKKNKME